MDTNKNLSEIRLMETKKQSFSGSIHCKKSLHPNYSLIYIFLYPEIIYQYSMTGKSDSSGWICTSWSSPLSNSNPSFV